MGISPSGQQLAASQSAARSTAQTNQTTFHQHRHTSHRSVRAVSHCPSHFQSAVTTFGKFFSQNQQHILNTHFLYHIAVYCLYCTITSPCKASTAQSLRRVLPLLYNHFTVYCLYCTITSPCTAFTVQSLRRVLPLLYNHFTVYCLYCTITSPCTAFTVKSFHRVLPLP